MAKIFGFLTLAVLLIACFLGLKNKTAHQKEIGDRQEIEAKLAKTEARLELAKSNLAATIADHDEVKAEIPKVEAQKKDQETANAELTSTKDAKTKEVEENKIKLEAAQEKIGALGNIKDLATKMGNLFNESRDLDVSISSNDVKLANLTAENSRVDAQVAEQRKQADLRSKGESFPTLQTRISAIYPNWGFVTLSAGNTAGVITNSTLDVLRNDEVIAKLLVTAVERNTASATIIPDSVKAGTVLMTGDRVVPGLKVTEADKKSASPGPVPAPANLIR